MCGRRWAASSPAGHRWAGDDLRSPRLARSRTDRNTVAAMSGESGPVTGTHVRSTSTARSRLRAGILRRCNGMRDEGFPIRARPGRQVSGHRSSSGATIGIPDDALFRSSRPIANAYAGPSAVEKTRYAHRLDARRARCGAGLALSIENAKTERTACGSSSNSRSQTARLHRRSDAPRTRRAKNQSSSIARAARPRWRRPRRARS